MLIWRVDQAGWEVNAPGVAGELAVHLAVVGLEEPDLRRKFGASCEAYRRAVPRWLPRRPVS
jgi:protein-S-isoprenylcysteine O-methyltransferase Ste14